MNGIEHLSSLLAMVGLEPHASTIMAWTEEQREQAEVWATATHYRASDNDVEVPARPDFLPQPWSGPMRGEGIWSSNPTVF